MKFVKFDKTENNKPEEFFEQLEFDKSGHLIIMIISDVDEFHTMSIKEDKSTSLIVSVTSNKDDTAHRFIIFGSVAPEELKPYLNKKRRCMVADIVNEVQGVEEKKYLDWETGLPVIP